MDYEQDYSKLTQGDNRWYNFRVRRTAPSAVSVEEDVPSVSANDAVALDNEDFN